MKPRQIYYDELSIATTLALKRGLDRAEHEDAYEGLSKRVVDELDDIRAGRVVIVDPPAGIELPTSKHTVKVDGAGNTTVKVKPDDDDDDDDDDGDEEEPRPSSRASIASALDAVAPLVAARRAAAAKELDARFPPAMQSKTYSNGSAMSFTIEAPHAAYEAPREFDLTTGRYR